MVNYTEKPSFFKKNRFLSDELKENSNLRAKENLERFWCDNIGNLGLR